MKTTLPSIPFIGAVPQLVAGCPAVFAARYDLTASFRKGTAAGPGGIREVSDAAIETYSPVQNLDLEDFIYSDLGDLDIDPRANPENVFESVYTATKEILTEGGIPVLLGGEHSVSPGAIRAAHEKHPDLVVIQIDAHADLRESYEDQAHSHACAMRRVLDFLPSNQLLQVGIRSGTKEEFAEMRDEDRLVDASGPALRDALERKGLVGAPLWITFDIDAFDPAEAPGTGTPEAGGIRWAEADSLREALVGETIAGFDIVEVAPDLDPTGITAALAAKLLREWLLTTMR